MARKKKTRSIVIVGKRWLDKINGNTYFSAVGIVNGEIETRLDFCYGSGDQYVHEITERLKGRKFLKGIEKHQAIWNYCSDNDIKLVYLAADVARRKDL